MRLWCLTICRGGNMAVSPGRSSAATAEVCRGRGPTFKYLRRDPVRTTAQQSALAGASYTAGLTQQVQRPSHLTPACPRASTAAGDAPKCGEPNVSRGCPVPACRRICVLVSRTFILGAADRRRLSATSCADLGRSCSPAAPPRTQLERHASGRLGGTAAARALATCSRRIAIAIAMLF